jgi:predicted ATPase
VDSRKEIQIDSVGVLRVRRPDRVEIPVEALSSGERQLLIMLGHLYFNSFGDRSSVFIIDEPEVSLHLRWQEMLLEKMMESNPRAQVIVATHSPEVVGEFHNHCVGV